MTTMKFAALALGVALAGCSSGFDMAKQEAIDSCISSGAGRLTEGECSCMIGKAFDTLDSDEKALLGKIAKTEKGISDDELADQIGMDRREMQRTLNGAMSKIRRTQFSSARQCIGQ